MVMASYSNHNSFNFQLLLRFDLIILSFSILASHVNMPAAAMVLLETIVNRPMDVSVERLIGGEVEHVGLKFLNN